MKHSPAWAAASVLVLVLFVLGCDTAGGEGSAWPGVIATLPDGTVHVRNPRGGAWAEGAAWSATPSLQIGSVASGKADQFGIIGDVTADPSGEIYVLETTIPEIRVFSPDGTWLRTMGRRGGGPGELERAGSLDWGPEGRLWVTDSGNYRFQIYDTTGQARGSHRYAPQMYRYGDVWGPDDLLYTYVARNGPTFQLDIVRRRVRADTLVPMDTLPVPMVSEGAIVPVSFQRDGKAFTLMAPIPFQATAKRLLVPGGGWWLSHAGEAYRLARIGFTRDTLLLTERPYDPVAVSEADVQGALSAWGVGSRLDREQIPQWHPPVEELAQLPDGHLLVRRQVAAERVGYDVFDPRGIFLGTLAWEGVESFTLHSATDSALYGTIQDELGVGYVVRVDLER